MGNRGDGPYTHSFANGNGPGIPAWLRHSLEYAMAREAQYSSWTVMA